MHEEQSNAAETYLVSFFFPFSGPALPCFTFLACCCCVSSAFDCWRLRTAPVDDTGGEVFALLDLVEGMVVVILIVAIGWVRVLLGFVLSFFQASQYVPRVGGDGCGGRSDGGDDSSRVPDLERVWVGTAWSFEMGVKGFW